MEGPMERKKEYGSKKKGAKPMKKAKKRGK